MRNLIRRFFSAIADGIGSGISTMATTGKKKYLNLEGLTYLCSKIKDALTLKLDKSQIVQNATTAATDKVPSAAVAKNLQDQITQLNTNKLGYDFIMLADSSYPFAAVNTQKSLTLERIKDCSIVFIKVGLIRSGEAGAGTSYTEATMAFSDYSERRLDSQGFCIYTSANWNCFGGVSVNFATGEIIYQIAGCEGWAPTNFTIKRVLGLK